MYQSSIPSAFSFYNGSSWVLKISKNVPLIISNRFPLLFEQVRTHFQSDLSLYYTNMHCTYPFKHFLVSTLRSPCRGWRSWASFVVVWSPLLRWPAWRSITDSNSVLAKNRNGVKNVDKKIIQNDQKLRQNKKEQIKAATFSSSTAAIVKKYIKGGTKSKKYG